MSLFGDNLKDTNQQALFGNSNGNNKNGIIYLIIEIHYLVLIIILVVLKGISFRINNNNPTISGLSLFRVNKNNGTNNPGPLFGTNNNNTANNNTAASGSSLFGVNNNNDTNNQKESLFGVNINNTNNNPAISGQPLFVLSIIIMLLITITKIQNHHCLMLI